LSSAQIDVLTNWVTANAAYGRLTGRPSPPSVVVHRTFLIAVRAIGDLVVRVAQPSTILQPQVVDALNDLAAWDLAVVWSWMNAAAAQRDPLSRSALTSR
jgi:hypothetical protein